MIRFSLIVRDVIMKPPDYVVTPNTCQIRLLAVAKLTVQKYGTNKRITRDVIIFIVLVNMVVMLLDESAYSVQPIRLFVSYSWMAYHL